MPAQTLVKGRIVWGHPAKLEPKKDNQKNTIMKDGQPVMQCSFGIAIERNEFYQNVLPLLINEARTAFPQVSFNGQGFVGVPPKFAWKYKDGEIDIDDKGKPYREREGYAGHVVLTVSTQGFTPPIYKHDGVKYNQIGENEIKCGDYVGVSITVKYNGAQGTNTPGLYVNPDGVTHIAYMPEIVGARRDPNEMFANMQVGQLPAGASTTPLMPAGPMPAQPQAAAAPQPYVAPVAAQPAPQQYAPAPQPQQYAAAPLPAPAHDFVHNATGQQPAPQQYAPAPQPQQYAPAPVQPQAYAAAPQPQQYAPAPAAPAAPYVMPGMPAGR